MKTQSLRKLPSHWTFQQSVKQLFITHTYISNESTSYFQFCLWKFFHGINQNQTNFFDFIEIAVVGRCNWIFLYFDKSGINKAVSSEMRANLYFSRKTLIWINSILIRLSLVFSFFLYFILFRMCSVSRIGNISNEPW